ncbi:MAG: glycosyltransferase family 39 protein [bacterium]
MDIKSFIKRRSLFHIALLVLFTVIIRVGFIFLFIENPNHIPQSGAENDAVEYDALAVSLLNGDGYKYYSDGPPTAQICPVYPLFLASIYYLFGHDYQIVRIIHALIDGVTSLFIYLIALIIFKNHYVGLLSMMMFALHPTKLLYTGYILTETLFTFLLICFAFSLLCAFDAPSKKRFLLAGLLLGLATLCRPTTILFPFFILLTLCVIFWGNKIKIIIYFVTLLIGFWLILSPWIIRNYMVFHTFVPTSTLGGYTLYIGHYLNGVDTIPLSKMPPHIKEKIKNSLKIYNDKASIIIYRRFHIIPAVSEPYIDKIFYKEAVRNICSNPRKFSVLMWKKFLRFWFHLAYPSPSLPRQVMIAIIHGILISFAIVGCIFGFSSWIKRSLPIIILVGYFTLVHMIVLAFGRFNIPVIPYVMIFASWGMLISYNLLRGKRFFPIR